MTRTDAIAHAKDKLRSGDFLRGVGSTQLGEVVPSYTPGVRLGDLSEALPGYAIESVLAQTHPPVEVVVVDDGSTDETSAVAAAFPGVRYIRQDNRGLAAARWVPSPRAHS